MIRGTICLFLNNLGVLYRGGSELLSRSLRLIFGGLRADPYLMRAIILFLCIGGPVLWLSL